MSTFFYDVCIHGDDYEEQSGVEFANPISVGDFVTDGVGGCEEYEVFQVVHSSTGGGSAAHCHVPKTT